MLSTFIASARRQPAILITPFDIKRTEIGERLYRLKYRNDETALADIVDTAEQFIRETWNPPIETVVPAPSSMVRKSQPVVLLARELAGRLTMQISEDAIVKIKPTPPMKNIPDLRERQKVLEESVKAGVAERHKVFVAGSRRVTRLTKEVKLRLDKIIKQGLTVLIGDANGADKAAQEYLLSKSYSNVMVFCMEGYCRNNAGDWPKRKIEAANASRRNFEYFSAKDRAMAGESDYGLMLWDGKSRGTLRNILDLTRRRKPVVVCLAPSRSFLTLRDAKDVPRILSLAGQDALEGIDDELQTFAMNCKSSRKADQGLSGVFGHTA